MVLAVTKAKAANSGAIICASTGNTSAAAAAYAARAGIKCFVVIPEHNVAAGKLAQAIVYGATIVRVQSNFDGCVSLMQELDANLQITVVNSANTDRMHGQKTAAFEIVDALGFAPDYHCIAVGNASNICAYWCGYQEYYTHKISTKLPIMVGYQAAGAAPIVDGKAVTNPTTIASAICIGKPQAWQQALVMQNESSGWFAKVTDAEILAAQAELARLEGIFVEPAAAATIAGIKNDAAAGKFAPGSTIACTLTGNGLKDVEVITQHYRGNLKVIEPKINKLKEILL
jgi:threonine synthase